MRSTLSQYGKALLGKKTIALRPEPLIRKPPTPEPPYELAQMSSWERQVYLFLKEAAIAFRPEVTYGGGVGILGGMRVDFILFDRNIALRIQGPWHLFPGARARDEMQRQYLVAQGYTVIDFWEDDLRDLATAFETKVGIPIRGR